MFLLKHTILVSSFSPPPFHLRFIAFFFSAMFLLFDLQGNIHVRHGVYTILRFFVFSSLDNYLSFFFRRRFTSFSDLFYCSLLSPACFSTTRFNLLNTSTLSIFRKHLIFYIRHFNQFSFKESLFPQLFFLLVVCLFHLLSFWFLIICYYMILAASLFALLIVFIH